MNIKDIFLLLAATCIFSLGFAQCPDSVRVYVNPEVICPGEIAHLSTDSTLLHCVNIGDIICVNSNTQDTAIVTLSDWNRISSTYTPIAIVFYVDETCQHGWAVNVNNPDEPTLWDNYDDDNGYTIIDGLDEHPTMPDCLYDIDGFSNTQIIRNARSNIPIIENLTDPFYIPALGQLNYLFAQQNIIANISASISSPIDFTGDYFWSATPFQYNNEDDIDYVWVITSSGDITYISKDCYNYESAYRISILNF